MVHDVHRHCKLFLLTAQTHCEAGLSVLSDSAYQRQYECGSADMSDLQVYLFKTKYLGHRL